MKAVVSRGAIIAFVLLVGFVVFSAEPSIAETLLSQFQVQEKESKQNPAEVLGKPEVEEVKVEPSTPYVATAYSLRGRTASGRMVSRGLIAADPRVLPLGSLYACQTASLHASLESKCRFACP